MDEDVEAVSLLVPMEGNYRGHDGIRRWLDNLLGVFPDYTAYILEVRESWRPDARIGTQPRPRRG